MAEPPRASGQTGHALLDVPKRLDLLEKQVDDGVDPERLYDELVPLVASLPPESSYRPRALRLLGVVNNRREDGISALANFSEARALALKSDDYSEIGAIARETSVVYAWRGDDREAARELLHALACASATRDRHALSRAFVEGVRVNMEGGRYQQAEMLYRALETSGLQDLPVRQQLRAKTTLCQILNRRGHHEEAFNQVTKLKSDIPATEARLRFLISLEEARALAGLGRADAAEAALALARDTAIADDDRFRRHEFREAEGELKLCKGDCSAAARDLREMAHEFVDQQLIGRAASTQLKLAKALVRIEEVDEAKTVLSSALRNAVLADLPDLADRIRSEMITAEGGKFIEDLTQDIETVGGSSGLHRCFALRERLGRGGFSEVHRAIDLRDGSEVALKKIDLSRVRSAERRRHLVASVKNEYGVALSVLDPKIARVRELLMRPDGTLFIVQDYVNGPSLRQLLMEGASQSELLRLLADVCDGLSTLHSKQIIHRDLKPENVIVSNGRYPVLIDLGISVILGQEDALAQYGSHDYIAPEQARGLNVDHRADIYSLGKMVAEIWDIKGPSTFGRMATLKWLSMPRLLRKLVRQMLNPDPCRRPRDLKLIGSTLRLVSDRISPTR